MHKHTIDVVDFNGVKRPIELYFHLSEDDIVTLQLESELGIQEDLMSAVRQQTIKELYEFVKKLIDLGYGIKSTDGLYFRKSPEILADFKASAAYSPLLFSLFEDEGKRLVPFINAMLPADLIDRTAEKMKNSSLSVDEREALEKAITLFKESESSETQETNTYQPSAREVFENVQASGSSPAPTPSESVALSPEEWKRYQEFLNQQGS